MKKNLLLLSVFIFLCSSCNRDGTQGGGEGRAGGQQSPENEQEVKSFNITLKLIKLDDPSANQAIFRSKVREGQERIARVDFKQGGCVTLQGSDFKTLSIQIGEVNVAGSDWLGGGGSAKPRMVELQYECNNQKEKKCVSAPNHYTMEVQTNYYWYLWWGYAAKMVPNKAAKDSEGSSSCVQMQDVNQ